MTKVEEAVIGKMYAELKDLHTQEVQLIKALKSEIGAIPKTVPMVDLTPLLTANKAILAKLSTLEQQQSTLHPEAKEKKKGVYTIKINIPNIHYLYICITLAILLISSLVAGYLQSYKTNTYREALYTITHSDDL